MADEKAHVLAISQFRRYFDCVVQRGQRRPSNQPL